MSRKLKILEKRMLTYSLLNDRNANDRMSPGTGFIHVGGRNRTIGRSFFYFLCDFFMRGDQIRFESFSCNQEFAE